YLAARRQLLIGRIEKADRILAEVDAVGLSPLLRTVHELVVAGVALRRGQAKMSKVALARAEQEARQAGIPALIAEVDSAKLVLTTPAARLAARGTERPLLLEQVEELLASPALVIDACRYVVRHQSAVISTSMRMQGQLSMASTCFSSLRTASRRSIQARAVYFARFPLLAAATRGSRGPKALFGSGSIGNERSTRLIRRLG